LRLRFSRTADYGLRAVLEVARAPEGSLVTRSELASATDAPTSVLAQALAALVRADVLDAQAGPRGGYRLAREPEELSIYAVVVAVDRRDVEPQCVLRETSCAADRPCAFHDVLSDAQERFLDVLRATTLADVLAGRRVVVGSPT
jgi:Rrf2 family protein